jgi:hypothetical protein
LHFTLSHIEALTKERDRLREALMGLLEFVDPNEVLDYEPVVRARATLQPESEG